MNKPLPTRLSKPGPLLEYLGFLYAQEAQHPELKGTFSSVVESVKTALTTKEGAILLDLLIKSTQEFRLPIDADSRALDALNAQAFIALDLRRIVSNELEQLIQQQKNMVASR